MLPDDTERVVITGIGVVSGFGKGAAALAQGLKEGRTCIRFQPGLDEDLPCRIGADAPAELLDTSLDFPVGTRSAAMALAAAEEAWRDAGREMGHDTGLLKIHASIGWGPYDFEELRAAKNSGIPLADHFVERTQCGYGESVLEHFFRPGLGVAAYLSACAASTQALGRAFYDLKYGRCRISLAGGADSRLHVPGIMGYSKLGALATGFEKDPGSACRPFDAQRSGFVIGEGAGFVVMETLANARARGVEVLAEVLAASTNTDAYRLTDPHPDGVTAARCIRECLDRAGLVPDDLDYIQAHGTGTPANDRAEVASIRGALGESATRIPVSSLKPYFGHLSMAAGALEVVASVQALRESYLPRCLNLEQAEEGFDLNFVRDSGTGKNIRTLLKNSFGFGGQNACLILRK